METFMIITFKHFAIVLWIVLGIPAIIFLLNTLINDGMPTPKANQNLFSYLCNSCYVFIAPLTTLIGSLIIVHKEQGTITPTVVCWLIFSSITSTATFLFIKYYRTRRASTSNEESEQQS